MAPLCFSSQQFKIGTRFSFIGDIYYAHGFITPLRKLSPNSSLLFQTCAKVRRHQYQRVGSIRFHNPLRLWSRSQQSIQTAKPVATKKPKRSGGAAKRRFNSNSQTTAQQGAAPDRLQLRSFLATLPAAGELSRSVVAHTLQVARQTNRRRIRIHKYEYSRIRPYSRNIKTSKSYE